MRCHSGRLPGPASHSASSQTVWPGDRAGLAVRVAGARVGGADNAGDKLACMVTFDAPAHTGPASVGSLG